MAQWNEKDATWNVDWYDNEPLRKVKENNPEDSITKDVIKDLQERERFGALKYGKFLTHHTTEDTMQHLYEELLDAACYIRTIIKQRDHAKKS